MSFNTMQVATEYVTFIHKTQNKQLFNIYACFTTKCVLLVQNTFKIHLKKLKLSSAFWHFQPTMESIKPPPPPSVTISGHSYSFLQYMCIQPCIFYITRKFFKKFSLATAPSGHKTPRPLNPTRLPLFSQFSVNSHSGLTTAQSPNCFKNNSYTYLYGNK